jgi:hypothetical protein
MGILTATKANQLTLQNASRWAFHQQAALKSRRRSLRRRWRSLSRVVGRVGGTCCLQDPAVAGQTGSPCKSNRHAAPKDCDTEG